MNDNPKSTGELGLFIVVYAFFGCLLLAGVYGLVRFVRWAWYQ